MPIFKSIITGLATQIMNQGIRKFQSQTSKVNPKKKKRKKEKHNFDQHNA